MPNGSVIYWGPGAQGARDFTFAPWFLRPSRATPDQPEQLQNNPQSNLNNSQNSPNTSQAHPNNSLTRPSKGPLHIRNLIFYETLLRKLYVERHCADRACGYIVNGQGLGMDTHTRTTPRET